MCAHCTFTIDVRTWARVGTHLKYKFTCVDIIEVHFFYSHVRTSIVNVYTHVP